MKIKVYLPKYLWDGRKNTVLKKKAAAVSKGKFVEIGCASDILALYPDAEKIDCPNMLMLPAFVDAHDHGRGLSPASFGVSDDALEQWLQDLGRLPEIPHYIACLYDGLKLASSGVSTVLHSHNPNRWEYIEEEMVEAALGYCDAGIRCILCPPYLDQNKGVYDDREQFIDSLPRNMRKQFLGKIIDKRMTLDAYFALVERLKVRLQDQISSGQVEIQLHPNGGQWCSDEALLSMCEYCRKNGMKMHMHLLETKYQAAYAERKWGCSFIRHYQDLGILGSHLSLAHAVWIDETDMQILSDTGTRVVTNPSSNLRLRSGIFPLQKALYHGLHPGLGMDGCAFDDDQDFIREMRTAWFNPSCSGIGAKPDHLIPLKMATSYGTEITSYGQNRGTIEKGRTADFVLIDLRSLKTPWTSPDTDILELFLQRASRKNVQALFVSGEQVYKNDKENAMRLKNAGEILAAELEKNWVKSFDGEESRILHLKIAEFYKKWI